MSPRQPLPLLSLPHRHENILTQNGSELVSPQARSIFHDTEAISNLYMQRPAAIASMGFGEWVNQAWQLDDDVLKHCNVRSAKTLIVLEGYNTNDLAALHLFNQTFKDI